VYSPDGGTREDVELEPRRKSGIDVFEQIGEDPAS
jgi:hypothetical protein